MSKNYYTVCTIQKGKYGDYENLLSKYTINNDRFNIIF